MSDEYGHPLEDGEIRLLTIHPELQDGLVSCSLNRYSLNDFKQVYRQFLNSYDSSKTPKRWLISTWASIQQAKTARRGKGAEVELMDSFTPNRDCYRFQWGDFATLSYAWASGRQARMILNGQGTIITKNLDRALRQFAAEGGRFSGSYKLWVDALCINQLDQDEVADQVSKMREIYSQSWAVVAWLGRAKNNSDQGIRLLKSLARLSEREKDELSGILDNNPKHFGRFAFYGLENLMARDYWYRLWIIQEIVLGSTSTVLRCGKDALDWETFCRGISALYHGGIWAAKDRRLADERQEKNLRPDPRWAATSIHLISQSLQQLGEFELRGGERPTMRKLLDLARSQCREVKDKVFGLMGMMEPDIVQQLVGTYSGTTSEIFTATTVAFIEHYNNLEPLREANPWGEAESPSWVVDWNWKGRFRHSKPELIFVGPYWNRDIPEPRPDTIYCADGRRKAQYNFLPDGQLLKCRGFIMDKLCGLGACGREYFGWDKSTLVSPGTQWRSVYGDTAKALYRLLLLGRICYGEHVSDRHSALLSLPPDHEPAFQQFKELGWSWMSEQDGYYFRWAKWHVAHMLVTIDGKRLSSYFSQEIPKDASEFDYAEVMVAAQRTGVARRLMFTEKGYMGWAPDNVYGSLQDQSAVGDMVCVVFGCSTPLVIRPKGEHFQVLGEAYVEGLMDGEAIERLERGEFTEQDLIFC